MTSGFEEWVTARAPALLALASALVEDERRADAAVTRALGRISRAWDRIAYADPDLEARRLVVRACSAPRRAATVLRALENRSDAEIAEILGCSESAARRHVERGLAEADQGRATDASSVRDELVARAGSAPTQLLTRPPETHAPAGPPRRRGGWLAALAVLALVGGVAYIAHASQSPAGVISYPKVDAPDSWRHESYDGVQLQVPDTWGWGASPVRSAIFSGRRHLGSCGTDQAAVLSPTDDSTYISSLTGFVGRPAVVSERCMTFGSDGTLPTGDAVWFDSPLAVGVKAVAGNVAETRAVGGQHVTVFAPHSSLRRQILGTVEQTGDVDANGCPTHAVVRPVAGTADAEPDSLSVCVYSQDTGVSTLLFSARLSSHHAREYVAHVAAGSSTAATDCSTPNGRWVTLGLHGDGDTRWDVVNLACDRIEMAGRSAAVLTPATVQDWALGGVTAYVSAPRGGPALDDHFRAPSG